MTMRRRRTALSDRNPRPDISNCLLAEQLLRKVENSVATKRVNVWGGSASVGYAEKPTVSYAPLQGDRFVKQVMAPIGPETLGVMYLLSQGVETPAEDAEAGRITITRDKNGRVFDWSEVPGGFFAVHSDGSPAAGRYASVRYRGHTFHIDDGDLDTKSTFSLLTQLFALQAGEIKMSGPALTLPVGQ